MTTAQTVITSENTDNLLKQNCLRNLVHDAHRWHDAIDLYWGCDGMWCQGLDADTLFDRTTDAAS